MTIIGAAATTVEVVGRALKDVDVPADLTHKRTCEEPAERPMITARRLFVSFTFVMVGLLFRVGSRCGARRELVYSFENGLADSGNRLSANQGSTVDVEMAGHDFGRR